ncbi:MAG: AmmeMemoRadiSam system protein B [Myxococcaceae bacterium]|nr:AmmeMemoRadiSam system protein B [Myxococcaceae bacterium]
MTLLALTVVASLADAGASVEVVGTYPNDRRMWDGLVANAEPFTFDGPVVAAVAPHHLIDGFELAGFWKALAHQRPSTVVLLAPDHFQRSGGLAAARGVTWKTVYGALEPDSALTTALGLPVGSQLFVGEHAVHVHAPFIRRFLPESRFVPVVLRWEAPRADLERLASTLAKDLPNDTLVVASVDFSHYQPEPWASFHDEASHAAVTSGDLDGLFEREVDSPEALFVALRTAQLRGANRTVRVLHTNSQHRREGLVMDSTSHQYFVTTFGPPAPVRSISVTITGDVPPDAGLAFVGPWRWSPTRDAGMPSEPRLASLRGQEDRFFMGPDGTLFDLAPGVRVERLVRGQRLVVAGVDLRAQAQPPLDGDCVIALAHRGGLPLDEARRRARTLVQQGAHAVIGRGFGALAPVELVDGGVWAPSLGPLFGKPGPGLVLGLTCGGGLRVRSVPLRTAGGHPSLDRSALKALRGDKSER